MSRTFRRINQRHEYRWVLRDWSRASYSGGPAMLDARSKAGRRAIARFHSDAESTMQGSAPRWYRKIFDRSLRNRNNRQLRKWIDDPGYDPVLQPNHRHCANWSWW